MNKKNQLRSSRNINSKYHLSPKLFYLRESSAKYLIEQNQMQKAFYLAKIWPNGYYLVIHYKIFFCYVYIIFLLILLNLSNYLFSYLKKTILISQQLILQNSSQNTCFIIINQIQEYKTENKDKQMGVKQLLELVIQCRKILAHSENSFKYSQLIQKIDRQLVSQREIQRHQRNNNPIQQSSSLRKRSSKKKIFNVVSSKYDNKNGNELQRLNSSVSQFLRTNSKVSSQILPFNRQSSKVEQISLDNIHLAITSNNKFNKSHSILKQQSYYNNNEEEADVNNSIWNLKSVSQIKDSGPNNKSMKSISNSIQKLHQSQNQEQDFTVEDFFIIDFNFQTNQYQILPKKSNFNNKCTILIDIMGESSSPIKQKQNKLNKVFGIKKSIPQNLGNQQVKNSNQVVNNGNGVFPFLQIAQKSNIKKRQSSFQSIINSKQRYSIDAQQSSTINPLNSQSSQISLNQSHIQQLYQMREVIMNLFISTTSLHIRQIKPSSSMTQLLKLTTNPSSKNKKLEHIIIPSFIQIRNKKNIQTCNRYTHIIKTVQGVSQGLKYYQCERFYVIIERQKKFVQVENIVTGLIEKCFQLRIKNDKQVDNVDHKNLRKYIQQIALIPKQKLCMFSKKIQSSLTNFDKSIYKNYQINKFDPLLQVYLYCQAAINFKFTLQIPPNSETKSFNLLLILIYFVIFQYKIVFLATKGYQGIVSEIISALVHMIGHLRYVYPVILAVLTNHHIQFVNSPVPGMVLLWGNQSRHKKSIQYMKNKLKQQVSQNLSSSTKMTSSALGNSQSTIVIDMNKHEFVKHNFTHQELYVIESLHKYIGSRNKKQNLIEAIKNLINQKFLFELEKKETINGKFNSNANKQSQKGRNDWMSLLMMRLQRTQMFQQYMKYQESLKK